MTRRLATAYRHADIIHLVLDNLNIHCERSLTDTFGRIEGQRIWRRFQLHFTPKHGSWLNQAELELSLVSRGCLGDRRIPNLPALRTTTTAWTRRANAMHTRIDWRFTRKDARRKFGYQTKLSSRSLT